MGNEMICSDIKDMDIKLGGRKMAAVVYSNDEDGMRSFVIDGEEYVEDEERAIIPKCYRIGGKRLEVKEDKVHDDNYYSAG